MELGVSNLQTGLGFLYEGPRRLLLFRTEGAGQILHVDPELQIVHVRVYRGSNNEVLIGHAPFTIDSFAASVTRLIGRRDLPDDWRPAYDAWSERYAAGEVDAFSVRLRNIIGAMPSGAAFDYALPKRKGGRELSVLEAGILHVGSESRL